MNLKKIAVFCSGRGSNLAAIIAAITSGNLRCKVTAVISNKPEARALDIAKQANIPTYTFPKSDYPTIKDRDQAILKTLNQLAPLDLIVLVGYLPIVPPGIIEQFPNKIINIHPSLIPAYSGQGWYGEKIFQAVIANQEPKTGVTIHFVNEGIDTGQIILQQSFPVYKTDTPEIIATRSHTLEHQLIVKAIQKILHP